MSLFKAAGVPVPQAKRRDGDRATAEDLHRILSSGHHGMANLLLDREATVGQARAEEARLTALDASAPMVYLRRCSAHLDGVLAKINGEISAAATANATRGRIAALSAAKNYATRARHGLGQMERMMLRGEDCSALAITQWAKGVTNAAADPLPGEIVTIGEKALAIASGSALAAGGTLDEQRRTLDGLIRAGAEKDQTRAELRAELERTIQQCDALGVPVPDATRAKLTAAPASSPAPAGAAAPTAATTAPNVMTEDRRRELLRMSGLGRAALDDQKPARSPSPSTTATAAAPAYQASLPAVPSIRQRQDDGAPLSEDRRRELLGATALGHAILRDQGAAAARVTRADTAPRKGGAAAGNEPAAGNRAAPTTATADGAPMSEARRKELLAMSGLGRRVLDPRII